MASIIMARLWIPKYAMIILFDVDGVLVHSRAYHVSLQNAIQFFSRRMGLGEHTLTQHDIDVFESQSVTVEWESGAISVAALLVGRMQAAPVRGLPDDWWAALEVLTAQPLAIPRPDFSALARRVGGSNTPGRHPAHAALDLFTADIAGQPWASLVQPHLDQLLARYAEIDHAPVMQVFQNYAIGSRRYGEFYELPPHLEVEALLEQLDTPLVRSETRDRLQAALQTGQTFAALYTARPSLPPREVPGHLRGYTPEAEIALNLNGLSGIPITAFGKMDWIGHRIGRNGSDLIKPSPVHAMAALAAARTGLEAEALKAALAVERGHGLRYPLTACQGEAIHVFEDSANSLRAVTRAVELLNQHGLKVTLTRHGIAREGSPKHAALAQIADFVHPDVNAGLEKILGN